MHNVVEEAVRTAWSIAALFGLLLHLRVAPAPPEIAHAPPPFTGAAAEASTRAAQSLLRFEPLIGGRWVADGVLSGGHRYQAERRYEWFMDRRFVRVYQRLTVDSVTVDEEAVIGWDPGTNGLRFWSFASDGSYAEASERPATGDNRWVFEGRTVGGRGGDWRTTTLFIDPSSFSVLLEVRTGGDYLPAMTLAYHKVADQPETTPPDTGAVRIDTLVTASGSGSDSEQRLPSVSSR